jgi:hypothetical protein
MRNTRFSATKNTPSTAIDNTCGTNDYNFDPETDS